MQSIAHFLNLKKLLPQKTNHSTSLTESLISKNDRSSSFSGESSKLGFKYEFASHLLKPDDGYGTYTDAKQNTIKGFWKDGEIDPEKNEGTITYRNGNHYQGQLSNNKPDGMGTIHFKMTTTISRSDEIQKTPIILSMKGQWKSGILDNTNKIEVQYSDGSTYLGYLKNGVPHGEGTLYRRTDKIDLDKSSPNRKIYVREEIPGIWQYGEMLFISLEV